MPQSLDIKNKQPQEETEEDVKIRQTFIQKGVEGLLDSFIEDFIAKNPDCSPKNIQAVHNDMKFKFEELDRKARVLLTVNRKLSKLYGQKFADIMTENSKFHKVTSKEITNLFDELFILYHSDKLTKSIVEQRIKELVENCTQQIMEQKLHETIIARQAEKERADTAIMETVKIERENQELKRKLAQLETQQSSDLPKPKFSKPH